MKAFLLFDEINCLNIDGISGTNELVIFLSAIGEVAKIPADAAPGLLVLWYNQSDVHAIHGREHLHVAAADRRPLTRELEPDRGKQHTGSLRIRLIISSLSRARLFCG